jgi:uncharacterized protein with HEPN domain
LLFENIPASAEKITQYTSGYTQEEFPNDSQTLDAVVRNFEIIGEASDRFLELFRETNRFIDWFRIKGFRNKIVHDYMGIDLVLCGQSLKVILICLLSNLKSFRISCNQHFFFKTLLITGFSLLESR